MLRVWLFYLILSAPAAELRQPPTSRPYCSGALGFLPPSRHAGSGKASLAPCLSRRSPQGEGGRARRRPPRNDRVWAADVRGCFGYHKQMFTGNNIRFLRSSLSGGRVLRRERAKECTFRTRLSEPRREMRQSAKQKNGRDREIRQGAKRRRAVQNKPKAK